MTTTDKTKPLTAAQVKALCLLTPTWKGTPPKVQPATLAVLCGYGLALSHGPYPRCRWRLSAAGAREKARRTKHGGR